MKRTIGTWNVLIAIWAAAALAAQPSPDSDRFSVADFDNSLEQMKTRIWNLSSSAGGSDKQDAAGRTLRDDLSDFVLTDTVLDRFAGSRAQIVGQGGSANELHDLQTLAPLGALLMREECKLSAINVYWDGLRSEPAHATTFRAEGLLDRLPAARREAMLKELESLYTGFKVSRSRMEQDVDECETVTGRLPASIARASDIMGAYSDLRVKLATETDAAVNSGELQALSMHRTASCPSPPIPAPGSTRPTVRKSPDLGSLYPETAKRLGITGRVKVRLALNSDACVVTVSVAASSGSLQLDKAGLLAGLDMEFAPPAAWEAGSLEVKPDGIHYFVLPLTFSLSGSSEGAPALPPQP